MAAGVGKAANRRGVTLFTAASVHWADSTTATVSSKGVRSPATLVPAVVLEHALLDGRRPLPLARQGFPVPCCLLTFCAGLRRRCALPFRYCRTARAPSRGIVRGIAAGRFTSLLLLAPLRVAAPRCATLCEALIGRRPPARAAFCRLPYWKKRPLCSSIRSPSPGEKSGCLDTFWGKLVPARTPPWAWPPRRGPSSWRPASPPAPQPTLVVVAGEDAAVAFARNVAAYVGEERVLRFPERADVPLRPEAGRPSRHRPAHGGRLGAQERPRSRGGGERPGACACCRRR